MGNRKSKDAWWGKLFVEIYLKTILYAPILWRGLRNTLHQINKTIFAYGVNNSDTSVQ